MSVTGQIAPSTGGSSAMAGAPGAPGVIRVMLVDDSAVIRGLFTRALEADQEIQIISSVSDGRMAVNALKRHDVDVIVLDIEMPNLDGLSALPLLLEVKPDVNIIMASTLTRRNAEVSLKAMSAGAKDYIAKPSSTSELTSAQAFQGELIAKIKALAGGKRSQRAETPHRPSPSFAQPSASVPTHPAPVQPRADATPATASPPSPAAPPAAPPAREAPVARLARGAEIPLRKAPIEYPEVIAIGSSTGGPQALFTLLAGLGGAKQPILITQHMPPTFTTILAEHISKVTGRAAAEAKDGEAIQPGRIYIAPGDFHMTVETQAGQRVLRLLKTPPENFCRPAVDPMLRSLSQAYGGKVLCVILTGMGSDGLKGAQNLVGVGGTVL
ncbi:MAG: chemotaxis-specific protein-glutamate methyltransferase CheB, partial [Elsteraceae bacterium]